jgi:Arc/MetJ family transcription regulator
MATNLAIDPDLLQRAQAIGGEKTKKATVTVALQEYIARRAQAQIVESFHTMAWDEDVDYKESRRARDRTLGFID